jgi:hypothetical protein
MKRLQQQRQRGQQWQQGAADSAQNYHFILTLDTFSSSVDLITHFFSSLLSKNQNKLGCLSLISLFTLV